MKRGFLQPINICFLAGQFSNTKNNISKYWFVNFEKQHRTHIARGSSTLSTQSSGTKKLTHENRHAPVKRKFNHTTAWPFMYLKKFNHEKNLHLSHHLHSYGTTIGSLWV
jgi:hypothetical protein